MSIFITAFRLGAEPFFFSYAKNVNARQIYAVILHYFVIALALLFVALVANIELLKYFIRQEDYWVGLPAIPYLLFGYLCLGIYMNLSIWYRLSDQTRYGLYISVIGAVITIIFNFILIPKYSYMGSAWVSMLAYFVMMVISYVLGQKYYPIPYKLPRILLYLGMSMVLVVLSFWVFNRNIYIGNSLLLGFLGLIVYLEKAEVKGMLSPNKSGMTG
jgi:O-antigen/teichoic acid export membrane protein